MIFLTNKRIINKNKIKIVFQSSIDAFSQKIGIKLSPTRFRPNIVFNSDIIPNHQPFDELQWIGRSLQSSSSSLRFQIINKTVQCTGISYDPNDYNNNKNNSDDNMNPNKVLNIPQLLMDHFPQYGSYFGIYCRVEQYGTIKAGDTFILV
jgi:uncharacterized protein YcbX